VASITNKVSCLRFVSNFLSGEMVFRKKQPVVEDKKIDSTGWLINSGLAEFLLHSHEIKYMAMLGYTYLHGMNFRYVVIFHVFLIE
jgi:phage host-nuclease inhibitor protein Gam